MRCLRGRGGQLLFQWAARLDGAQSWLYLGLFCGGGRRRVYFSINREVRKIELTFPSTGVTNVQVI